MTRSTSEPGLPLPSSLSDLRDFVAREGFAFVSGDAVRTLLSTHGSLSDWTAFGESWHQLEVDRYMADGGRYRRRRHAVFAAARTGPIERQPHQPHYQSEEYNPLHGGQVRWFEPMTAQAATGPTMSAILEFSRSVFSALAPATTQWHIEAHQFRIEAVRGAEGRPTPEGLHRDGVDYVLVLLIKRHNVESGTTAIHASDGRLLGAFTLTNPFDAALVDDTRVAHGVTPIRAVNPEEPGYRDVLVVTFVASDRRVVVPSASEAR